MGAIGPNSNWDYLIYFVSSSISLSHFVGLFREGHQTTVAIFFGMGGGGGEELYSNLVNNFRGTLILDFLTSPTG